MRDDAAKSRPNGRAGHLVPRSSVEMSAGQDAQHMKNVLWRRVKPQGMLPKALRLRESAARVTPPVGGWHRRRGGALEQCPEALAWESGTADTAVAHTASFGRGRGGGAKERPRGALVVRLCVSYAPSGATKTWPDRSQGSRRGLCSCAPAGAGPCGLCPGRPRHARLAGAVSTMVCCPGEGEPPGEPRLGRSLAPLLSRS